MKPGDIYKHFKGGLYKILHLAEDSETQASIVVYQPLEGDKVYTRSHDMFTEIIERDGKTMLRFQKVN